MFDFVFSNALAALAKTNCGAAEYMMGGPNSKSNSDGERQPFLATVLRARLQQALYEALEANDDIEENNVHERRGNCETYSQIDSTDDERSEQAQRRKRKIKIYRGQAGTITAAWDASRRPRNDYLTMNENRTINESSSGAFIQTADGQCHGPFDVVIGADGVNSIIRQVLPAHCGDVRNANDKPKYANLKVFYTLRTRSIPATVVDEEEAEKSGRFTADHDRKSLDARPHELHQYLCKRSVVVRYPVADDVDMIAFLVRDYAGGSEQGGNSILENVTFSHTVSDANYNHCRPCKTKKGCKTSGSESESSSNVSNWSQSCSKWKKQVNDSEMTDRCTDNQYELFLENQQHPSTNSQNVKLNAHEEHIRSSTARLMSHCKVPVHLQAAWKSGFRYIVVAVHERQRSGAAQRRWTDGHRFVLVGDAAHAMTPFMAQGANQTVQDAHFLALCLRRHMDEGTEGVGESLREYEEMFREEVRSLTRKSRMLGNLLTMGGVFGSVVRRVVVTVVGRTGMLQKEMVKSFLPRFDPSVNMDVT